VTGLNKTTIILITNTGLKENNGWFWITTGIRRGNRFRLLAIEDKILNARVKISDS
jgi:hypothetical protein